MTVVSIVLFRHFMSPPFYKCFVSMSQPLHAHCKNNSVQKGSQLIMSNNEQPQKTYHKKATGNALATVKKHSKDNVLKLFGSCFW